MAERLSANVAKRSSTLSSVTLACLYFVTSEAFNRAVFELFVLNHLGKGSEDSLGINELLGCGF